jgi:hypothetical protein
LSHIEPERLQQYLAGETELVEATLIDQHLTDCLLCSDRLAAIAADDAHLCEMLALDEAEQAWIAGIDLTGPVLSQVTPWFHRWQWVAIAGLSLIAGGWLSQRTFALIGSLLGSQGKIGLTVNVAETLIPALWRFFLYITRGGVLATLWPALVLGGGLWLWRRHLKEEKHYA